MRRSSWYRPLGIWLALWFPLVLAGATGFNACPMHGVAASHAGMQHCASSAMAGEHHAADEPSPAPAHGHQQCTCIGCCVACSSAPSAPVTAVAIAARPAQSAPSALTTGQPLHAAAPAGRPYPTGPPSA